jgi:RNA polymerase sigma factor for flagellar operon FliA
MHPPGPKNPEHELISQAMPKALALARTIARRLGVQTPEGIEDCQQAACQALLEALPGHDPSRGPFDIYAWKWVAGAVIRLVRRERSYRRTGLDDALDATEALSDTDDPFAEDDEERDRAKSYCRWLTFTRFLGDTRAALSRNPEERVLRARAFEALERAVGDINEDERQVLALRYWAGLTWEQIGLAMGRSERQAKRIDERLRERLQRGLRLRGVEQTPPSA